MRLLFLIFLLANVAAAVYIYSAENSAGADAQIGLLQISPEKVRLLKSKAAPENREKSGAATPQPSLVCLEWGAFTADDAAPAAAALAKLGLGDRVSQREGGDSYGVFILPFKTRAEADKKAAELTGLGVSDFYVVQDSDPARFAIAMGVFKTEEGANNHLAQLRQRGVRSAAVSPRGAKTTTFVVRDPGDAVAARMAELKTAFPAATLRAAACAEARSG